MSNTVIMYLMMAFALVGFTFVLLVICLQIQKELTKLHNKVYKEKHIFLIRHGESIANTGENDEKRIL